MIKNEIHADNENVFKHLIKLATGTHPWMYLREYVQNGFDAHQKIKSDNKEVIVDFDHLYYRDHKVFKLCFIDNAVGMDPEECENYLLKMFRTTGTEKNFGIGSRITGAKRNKKIMVKTWKSGDTNGYLFILNINDDGAYLTKFDGYKRYLEIGDSDKPKGIENHGTCITFLGLNDNDNTMSIVDNITLPEREWHSATLNDIFFKVPKNIKLKCRVNYTKREKEMVFDETTKTYNFKQGDAGGGCRLINLKGNYHEYQKCAKSHGVVDLSDNTKVHWFILNKEKSSNFYLRRRRSRIAYVCDNENYDTKLGAKADFPRWNINYASDRIALFIEVDSSVYEPDVQRRFLKKSGGDLHSSGGSLPKENWQEDWLTNFPIEIANEEEEAASIHNSEEIDMNILNRLPFIKDEEIGKLNVEGFDVEDEIEKAMTRAIRISEQEKNNSKEKQKGTGFGDLNDFIRKKSSTPSKEKAVSSEANFMPKKTTMVVADDEEHTLFNWAANYNSEEDELIINSAYMGLSQVIKTYLPKNPNVAQAKKVNEFIVEGHINRLKLAVCQAKMIKSTLQLNDFEVMVSKQALTMVVAPNLREDEYMRKHVRNITTNGPKNIWNGENKPSLDDSFIHKNDPSKYVSNNSRK